MNNTTITLSFLVLILGSFGITQAYASHGSSPPNIILGAITEFEATGLLTPLDSLDGFGDIQVTDNDDPNPVITHDAPDAFPLGQTKVTWTATDSSGNTATSYQYITVRDTVPPVFTLLGDSTITITIGDGYQDPGATAIDNIDGDLSSRIWKTFDSRFNTFNPGTWVETYTVRDLSGNAATPLTRTVIAIHDIIAPTFTLIGPNPYTIPLNGPYVEPGSTCTDTRKVLPVHRVDTSDVDTKVAGTYSVEYKCYDSKGNGVDSSNTRTVIVLPSATPLPDTTAPVITLVGQSSVTHELNTTYSDQGATCTDNSDSNPTLRIDMGNVDFTTLGVSSILYDCEDSSGNTAAQETRTVTVIAVPDPEPTPEPNCGAGTVYDPTSNSCVLDSTPEPNDSEKIITDLKNEIVDLKNENDKLKQLIGSLEDQIDAIMVEFADSVLSLNNWFRIQFDLYKQFP